MLFLSGVLTVIAPQRHLPSIPISSIFTDCCLILVHNYLLYGTPPYNLWLALYRLSFIYYHSQAIPKASCLHPFLEFIQNHLLLSPFILFQKI